MHISLVLLIISLATPTICIPGDIQLELTHVDYGRQLTKLELIKRAARRSQARAALLTSKACNSNPLSRANIPIHPSGGLEYVLELAIGTPPRPYPLVLDTGSDLIWTQCKPCSRCLPQPSPLFDPSKSSTFSLLPCYNKLCQGGFGQRNCTKNHCMYTYSYGDQTYTSGSISSETFTFGTSSEFKAHIVFGCGTINGGDLDNSSGIAGFSREATSLVSQLSISGFSHCMTDDINKRSTLRFGTQEEIYRDIKVLVQTSKFVDGPPFYETLYFIAMTGITVGTKRLSIPKSVFNNGTLVDSGTAFTQLPEVAYNKLKEALLSDMKLSMSDKSVENLDCFSSPSILPSRVKAPKVILHFEGIDMKLPRENYIADIDDQGILCLTMMKTDYSFGILGNTQQINMQVMYDLKNSKLAIAPNQCYKK
ncbi:aspartic proteinase nepenthesin-2-like protein [Carex littledalei]|uniref:Aspartic proteinase nepenthesin-2-like protein n=1 Tax=Carex littledalei TaxID=544730 RepID=A0A833QRB8_9POAL|nr:aspartic proteinase nepenthesin-2-like protein [Carex littledalei]